MDKCLKNPRPGRFERIAFPLHPCKRKEESDLLRIVYGCFPTATITLTRRSQSRWHPKSEGARLVVGRTSNLVGLITAQCHVRRPLLSEEKTYVAKIPKAKDDHTTTFRLVNYSPPVQPAFWLHRLG